MSQQRFNRGRIRLADFDATSQQLDLLFDNGSVLAYTGVSEEVFRRLCQAPNPGTYWEDRIAEEYPKGRARLKAGKPETTQAWDDLFGGPIDTSSNQP